MKAPNENSLLSPLKGKVIAAFLLACIAIALAVSITYLSFNNLLAKVDEISSPNTKLKVLNNLFEQITQLDQQQRADAIRNPGKPYRDYLNESKALLLSIDSLAAMPWENKKQGNRLNSMKRILNKRDYLLIDYLKLKSNLLNDKSFSTQLDSLADILVESKPGMDSSIFTTQKKTTTTTYLPKKPEKKQPFFSRIFGKKKPVVIDSAGNRVEVKEEISVKVDTLAIAKQDSAIVEVGKIMKTLEEDQRIQSKQVLQRELDLINTNIILINQLLTILQEVENEEVASIERKNLDAGILVTSSIERIGAILIVFFLLAALLVFLILVDISKSNFYRLQLLKAKEVAEQLSKVKQRFLANMSHEIRTPLQSIIGFSEQLKNPLVRAEALNAIQSSSEHLLHIVNEMLDYSRIESDKFTINNSPFDLENLIDEVASVIRVQAEKKGLQFIIDKKSLPSSRVLGDDFRLRQILYNLLGNAVKFTKSGFVKLEVDVKQDLLIKCSFAISDSGIGISSQDVNRIFGQFEQGSADHNEEYGGAGLGLTIVKKLVELQRGTIQVKSTLGKGSTFLVDMTFEKARLPKLQPAEQVNISNPAIIDKVIVVDDDPLILRFCSILLEKHHIKFKAIQQPKKIFNENLKDVKIFFLDIRMPGGINGVDLCKEIRKKNKKAKIIALTAHVLPQEQASMFENGFDEVLIKPFREKEFMHVLGINVIENSSFDLSSIRKMTMGDENLLHSIVDQFIEETQSNLKELEEKIPKKDNSSVREIIHKLSGRTGQMGATEISMLLKEIEKELASGKPVNDILEKISTASDQLRNLLIDLQREILVTH
jgi:signal transduction histidine kinase/HPt (histidine-containing phosphotransfer) domain-containing protein